jgi:hypothetical protein
MLYIAHGYTYTTQIHIKVRNMEFFWRNVIREEIFILFVIEATKIGYLTISEMLKENYMFVNPRCLIAHASICHTNSPCIPHDEEVYMVKIFKSQLSAYVCPFAYVCKSNIY